MSGREFSKVSPSLWRSARFAGLSDKGKIGFVYFCTNAHVTSAGVYVLPDGYACSDLVGVGNLSRDLRRGHGSRDARLRS
jgi:hypothetical protein